MAVQKGVVIAAYKPKENPRFIVLKRKKNWEGWELPKGNLEDGDYEKTLKQELREEAGIEEDEIEELEDLEYRLEWTYKEDGEEKRREYKGFLVRVSEEAYVDTANNPHDEHESGFFFRYRDVKKMLTHEDQVEFLEKAMENV